MKPRRPAYRLPGALLPKARNESPKEPNLTYTYNPSPAPWEGGNKRFLITNLGQDVVPLNRGSRLVFGSVWILSLVLYASYTSNLVSFLTITRWCTNYEY